MSYRIAVMHEGRVIQLGTPEAIYHDPTTLFVATFIGTASLLPAKLVSTAPAAPEAEVCGRRMPVPSGPHAFAEGDAAMLVVRPERLELSASEPAGDLAATSLPVVVTHALFQGPVVRCTLQAQDGTEIVCHVDHAHTLPGLEPGRNLHVAWHKEAARLLPRRRAAVEG